MSPIKFLSASSEIALNDITRKRKICDTHIHGVASVVDVENVAT
jgi:hypothetical protein